MSIASNVIAWARGRVGQTVDAGECWDLANSALIAGGAHGSEHFGTIGDDVDYIWGDPISLFSVQAGDIVQTRDHVVSTEVTTITVPPGGADGTDTNVFTEERPHHTAIVTSLLDKSGTFATLEQNIQPKDRVVQVKRFNSRDVAMVRTKKSAFVTDPITKKKTAVTITTETTVTVTGTINAFRPVKR